MRKNESLFKICDFFDLGSVNVGLLLRSDDMPRQCNLCVTMNYNNFPKLCMFMKASVMLETKKLYGITSYCCDVCGVINHFHIIRKRV